MSQIKYADSVNIEWETVRNKKASQNASKKEAALKNIAEGELNENYVPRAIRDQIDEILGSSDSTYQKISNLNKIVYDFVRHKNNSNINWKKNLNIYIIHRACKDNKHEIIASMLDKCDDYQMYIDAISSTKTCNTPLMTAAYYGSDMCMNYLLNRGANVRHVNNDGEDISKILTVGLRHYIKRFPKASEIIKNRYDDCQKLVNQVIAGEKIKDTLGLNPEEKEVSEYIEEFNTEYTFDTLKEDVEKYISDPPKFRKLITFLKDNDFKELLIQVLDDEDIQDLLIDNPYVVQLV